MLTQPSSGPSRTGVAILCGLWLAVAVWAQDDADGLLARARALALAGRQAEAIPLYEQLVAETEQREGRDAWALVLLTYETAVQHHGLGAAEQAEALYRRSLAIAETHRGARDPATVPSLRGLATLEANQGRLDEAEALYRRALEIQEAVAGDQAGAARTLSELGVLCQLRGRWDDAERFYRRALETGEAGHLEAAEISLVAGNLAALYDRQERYVEAEPLWRRVLEIRGRLLEPDHPDLARAHEKLARTLYLQRRYAQAAAAYSQSLRIREQAGREDLAIAEVLGRIAACYRQLGRSAQAKAHFGMARAILDAQCDGRERTRPCLDASKNYRALSDEPLAPAAQPVPPSPEKIASAAPPPSAAAPAPPPSEGAVQPAPPATPPASPPPATAPSAPAPSASSPKPPPAATPQPPASTAGRRFQRAQVAARQDPREAAEILARLQESLPRLLDGVTARVVRVDLGERGVWHRVQIGAFERVAGAKALCDEIVAGGHEGCWVVTTED